MSNCGNVDGIRLAKKYIQKKISNKNDRIGQNYFSILFHILCQRELPFMSS